MTEIVTRSPLQTLSMSASQRPPARRRSARLAFDEEDTRPVKRTKTATGTSKQSNGRKTTASKKTNGSYDEDADGFQFRKASTRASSQPHPTLENAPVVQNPEATSAQEPAPAPPPARRKRTQPEPSAAAQAKDGSVSLKRRSARLSGDKDIVIGQSKHPPEKSLHDAPVPHVKARTKRAQTPAVSEAGEIQIEKKRGPTKIALPFSDTPVITRNKEMRKHSAEGHRRSSSNMRGRRASSLIDSGTSNAMPHSEVATEDFYKHISQELPEPRRMQQLLSWCGTRVLPDKPTGSSGDVNAILAARVVQEELLRDFSKKSELSDWFNREDVTPTVLVKKPNPRNIQNAAKLQELEREVQRLNEEKQAWSKALSSLKAPSAAHARHVTELGNATPEDLNPALLESPEQESVLSNFLTQRQDMDDIHARLTKATSVLEFKLDMVADGIHKLQKLKESADGVVSKVLGDTARALENRDRNVLERSGMERVGVGDILRGLSRT